MPRGLGEGFTAWLRVSRVSLPSPLSTRMQQAPSRDRPVTPLSSCGRGSSPWAPAADRCTTPPRRALHGTQTTPCHAFSGAARNPDHPRHAFSGAARNPDHPRLKRNNNIRRFTRSRGGRGFTSPPNTTDRGGPGFTTGLCASCWRFVSAGRVLAEEFALPRLDPNQQPSVLIHLMALGAF